MPDFKIGTDTPADVRFGSIPVSEIYQGSTLVYPIGGGGIPSDAYVTRWDTTLSYSGFTDRVALPLTSDYNYNFTVDWGDGTTGTITSHNDPNRTHIYTSDGVYTISIWGLYEGQSTEFSDEAPCLLEVVEIGNVGWTSLKNAFTYCENLTSFSSVGNYIASVQDFSAAWSDCYALQSFSADISGAQNLNVAWTYCASLSSFSPINLSSVLTALGAWEGCTNLQSFPSLSMPLCTDLNYAWAESGLLAFPAIDLSSATDLSFAWSLCYNLSAMGEVNITSATNVNSAWYSTAIINIPGILMPNVVDAENAFMNAPVLSIDPALPLSLGQDNLLLAYFLAGTSISPSEHSGFIIRLDNAGGLNGGYPSYSGPPRDSTSDTARLSLLAKGWTI